MQELLGQIQAQEENTDGETRKKNVENEKTKKITI